MSTISGSISRNTSRSFKFYLVVTTTNEPANYRYKVKVDAIMEIGTWGWDSVSESDSITISIGGHSSKKSFSGMNCTSHYTKYTMHTYTQYFGYSTADQNVAISAVSTDIAASGYGPGVCKASGSIKLGSVYSTSGTASISNIKEDVITVSVTGLPKAAYDRVIKYWNKKASQTSWSLHTQEKISANETPGTRSKNISSLIPNTTYNFDAIVYAGNGNVISHKYVNGTTAEASGELVLSEVDHGGMTATVIGMASTSAYDREVKFFYKRSDESVWTLASTKAIAAYTSAGSPTYTFSGLISGTKYDVKADFLIGGEEYKTTNTASCALPFDGVSVPEVTSVAQTAPSSVISISWHLIDIVEDSLDSTVFNVFIKRQNGEEILVGSVSGDSMAEPYETTTVYDAANWLLEAETITAYVTASNPYSSGASVSNEKACTVTRCFFWDTNKTAGEKFGITAGEWNRLKQYVNEAAELYPDYFEEIVSDDVSAGDIFTAVLANAASYGGDNAVGRYDVVLADAAMLVQSTLKEMIKEATGL